MTAYVILEIDLCDGQHFLEEEFIVDMFKKFGGECIFQNSDAKMLIGKGKAENNFLFKFNTQWDVHKLINNELFYNFKASYLKEDKIRLTILDRAEENLNISSDIVKWKIADYLQELFDQLDEKEKFWEMKNIDRMLFESGLSLGYGQMDEVDEFLKKIITDNVYLEPALTENNVRNFLNGETPSDAVSYLLSGGGLE